MLSVDNAGNKIETVEDIDKIKESHKKGQPVLVGTISIEKSEKILKKDAHSDASARTKPFGLPSLRG